MARLQILVHKSYHPYLEKNKQKVREDERKEEDRLKREEERVQLAVRPFILSLHLHFIP